MITAVPAIAELGWPLPPPSFPHEFGRKEFGIMPATNGSGRDDIGWQRAAVAIAIRQPADERAEAGHVGPAGIDQRVINPVWTADDRPVHAGIVLRVAMMHGADDGELACVARDSGHQLGDA